MENIASSVDSIAQYRFSLSLERAFSEHRRECIIMAMTAKEEEEEKIYFRVYRSISFFTGFVEYQEQGLHQQ
jgi:hypothetical protein